MGTQPKSRDNKAKLNTTPYCELTHIFTGAALRGRWLLLLLLLPAKQKLQSQVKHTACKVSPYQVDRQIKIREIIQGPGIPHFISFLSQKASARRAAPRCAQSRRSHSPGTTARVPQLGCHSSGASAREQHSRRPTLSTAASCSRVCSSPNYRQG